MLGAGTAILRDSRTPSGRSNDVNAERPDHESVASRPCATRCVAHAVAPPRGPMDLMTWLDPPVDTDINDQCLALLSSPTADEYKISYRSLVASI